MNAGPRQNNREFRELPSLRLDVDRATVLFHDDVMAHRKAKPGPFTRRLRREERIEHLFLHLGRNAGAVVANADLHGVTEISRGCTEDRIKTGTAILRLAFGYRIESIRDQI